MFMSLISHVVCAWFVFLIPCFSTFKTLSHVHLRSNDELDTLAMYWAVIGAFMALETTLGPFVSWLPFYWEVRTLFLLYLALPQTQGSTYVYKTYLQPFLVRNEADLDAGIVSVQSNLVGFARTRFSGIVDRIQNRPSAAAPTNEPGENANPQNGRNAPSLADSAKGLWDAYGPAVLGGLSRVYPSAGGPQQHSTPSTSATGLNTASTENLQQRRRSPSPRPHI